MTTPLDVTHPYTPSDEEIQKIVDIFMFHPVQPGQAERYEAIRTRARWFASFLLNNCPSSRELSLAIGKLQEAVMFANASIAIHEKYVDGEVVVS